MGKNKSFHMGEQWERIRVLIWGSSGKEEELSYGGAVGKNKSYHMGERWERIRVLIWGEQWERMSYDMGERWERIRVITQGSNGKE